MSNPHLLNTPAPPIVGASILRMQLFFSVIVAMTLMTCWFVFLWLGVGSFLTPRHQTQPVTPLTESEPPGAAGTPAAIDDRSLAELQLLSALQQAELQPRLASVKATLQSTKNTASELERQFNHLLHSSEGRRLATAASAIQFQFLQKHLASAIGELNSVDSSPQAPDQVATKADNKDMDLDEAINQLEKLETQLAGISQLLQQIEQLFAELNSNAGSPQHQTLAESIAALEQDSITKIESAVQQSLVVDAKRDQEEYDRVMGRQIDLRAEITTANGELDRVRQNSAQQLSNSGRQQAAESDNRMRSKAEDQKQLEKALPEIRNLLSPLITPGYRQPKPGAGMSQTLDVGPVSWSALLQSGAMNKDAKGLEKLFSLVQPDQGNDRPLGEFPQYTSEFDINKPAVLNSLRSVQSFLLKHGDAMVQAKLLAP